MILRNFISLRAFTVYMENSLWFEISLRSIWPKWNLHRSEFHSAQSHVNADNEVTSYQSEILSWSESEVSNRVHFGSHVNVLLYCSYRRLILCFFNVLTSLTPEESSIMRISLAFWWTPRVARLGFKWLVCCVWEKYLLWLKLQYIATHTDVFRALVTSVIESYRADS